MRTLVVLAACVVSASATFGLLANLFGGLGGNACCNPCGGCGAAAYPPQVSYQQPPPPPPPVYQQSYQPSYQPAYQSAPVYQPAPAYQPAAYQPQATGGYVQPPSYGVQSGYSSSYAPAASSAYSTVPLQATGQTYLSTNSVAQPAAAAANTQFFNAQSVALNAAAQAAAPLRH